MENTVTTLDVLLSDLDAIRAKIDAIYQYIHSDPNYKKLEDTEKTLLLARYNAAAAYANILILCIEKISNDDENDVAE